MVKSVVFQGETLIGEVEIHPQSSNSWQGLREIRVAGFSPASGRCLPLAVLLCIASGGVIFKMESLSPPSSPDPSPLSSMHAACLTENKTAVVQLEGEEIHLVAMPTRKNLNHCSNFWGFRVMPGLYNSCLAMLNLRCLGIVFDLDETLIVANTMRSFEDRIDGLQRKINNEMDQERITEMVAELKRYQDDKAILKQYIENDQVVDNGKVYIVQPEIVPPLSDNHHLISRPVIRLQDKNIILTRVNPAIRDTSVLVRLRPAWEDLRGYLTARGRKRFQVYVCTMAERDYAFEMWRLLDPESNLISHRELLDRIVCVKSGSRKSLFGVFKDGVCHPSMALVIDDRLKVWDEKDQSRVHVVPAFAPYYTPHAEANNTIPILCVARNVACNVRGGFFREFDEGILPRLSNIFYEDEMNFPSAPDVANYLSPVDDTSMFDGIKDDPEAQRRLKDPNYSFQSVPSLVNGLEPNIISYYDRVMTPLGAVQLPTSQMMMAPSNNQCLQPCASGKPFVQNVLLEPSLQGSPATEEGEVPESELDPDTRRRLLILQHGQDTRDPPPPPASFVGRPPFQIPGPSVQSRGSSLPLDEEISPRLRRRLPNEFSIEPDSRRFGRKRFRPSFYHGQDYSDRAINENQRLPLQVHPNDGRLRLNHAVSSYNSFPGEEMPIVRNHYRDAHLGPASASVQYPENPVSALHEIAVKCGAKVEYRTALCDTTELQFFIEVVNAAKHRWHNFDAWFAGEKIGEGIGRTRREAQHQAAQASVHALANNYLSSLPDAISQHADLNKFPPFKENGFIHDPNSVEHQVFTRDNYLSVSSTADDHRYLDQKVMEGKKAAASITALKELCTKEGFNLVFHSLPSLSSDSESPGEMHAQVEVAGQILGMGSGITWEEAKFKAAEKALGTLKSMLGQFTYGKSCSPSPRQTYASPNKRLKSEFTPVLLHHDAYSKNNI